MSSVKELPAFKAHIESELKEIVNYGTEEAPAYKRSDIAKVLKIKSISNYIDRLKDDDFVTEGDKKRKYLSRHGVCKIIKMMKKLPDVRKLEFFKYDPNINTKPNFTVCRRHVRGFFQFIAENFIEGDEFIAVEEHKLVFTYVGNANVETLANLFPDHKVMYLPVKRTIDTEFMKCIAVVLQELTLKGPLSHPK